MSSETSNKQLIQFGGMLVVVSYLFGAALQDAYVIENRFISLSIGGVLFVLSYILGFIKLSLFLNFIGFNILYWNVSTYGVAFSLLGIIALIINLSYAASVLYIFVVNSLDEMKKLKWVTLFGIVFWGLWHILLYAFYSDTWA